MSLELVVTHRLCSKLLTISDRNTCAGTHRNLLPQALSLPRTGGGETTTLPWPCRRRRHLSRWQLATGFFDFELHWAIDFVHDQLATGRKIRVLAVVDTFSRYSPALSTHG